MSEQNLMDCSTKEGNYGCNGGLMTYSFQYIKDNDGIDTEMSYPYEAKQGTCRFNRTNVGGHDTGFHNLPKGIEVAMQAAVANVGPVAAAMDGDTEAFEFYKKGIIDDPKCSKTQLSHSVTIIGYGTLDGKDYWLLKNSWGTKWGMKGFAMLARNKDNMCGIASESSYPLV